MNDPDGVVALLDAAAFLLGVREWLGLLISWWWEAAVAFAFAAVVIETLYQPGADPENPSKWLRQPSLSRRWRRSLKRSPRVSQSIKLFTTRLGPACIGGENVGADT